MSGFGLKKEAPKETTNFDKDMANKLARAVSKVKHIRSMNLQYWTEEFRKFRTYKSEEEISSVLEWYSCHIKDEYVPKATNAKSFKAKFDKIKLSMSKLGGDIDVKVEITPIAHKLQKSLNFDWPSNEKKDELKFLQLTYNYAYSFDRKLKKLLQQERELAEGKNNSKETRLYRLVHFVYWRVSCPYETTLWWATLVHEFSWKWPNYSGHLLSRVLSDNTEMWNKHMAKFVAEFAGDGGQWEEVQLKLKEIEV